MSVLATMQMLPDPMAAAPKRQASDTDTVPPPSWIDAAAANWRLNEDDSPEFVQAHKISAYADLSDALVKMGRDPSRYVSRQKPGAQMEAWGRVWADVEAERRRNPQAFADIPSGTQDDFEAWAAGRKGGRARDAATAAQGGLGTALLPGLGYGLLNGFQPENLPFLFMGGQARSAAEFVMAQGLAGAQMTAIQAPQTARARIAMGEGYSPEQLGTDLVTGAAANVAIGAVATYGPALLAKALRVPREGRTPAIQAAINVAQHAEDVNATNPFENSNAGIDAHLERLTEAAARIEAGGAAIDPAADRPTRLARSPAAPAETAGSIDTYMAAARQQESGGRDGAANPMPGMTASGRYGFTNGTWTTWYHKVFPNSGLSEAAIVARKGDGAAQDRVMRAMTEDNAGWLRGQGEAVSPGNLYVVHHMGQGGARAIFEAAPGVRLDALLPAGVMGKNPHLQGMTAGDFIAWADRKMGGSGEGGNLAPIDVPAPPTVRPAALDAVRPSVALDGREIPMVQFRPDEIGVDASLMQFKSGGDANGVTERLQGVQQWDSMAAGAVTVWEGLDGRRLIADGHQRLGLANRMLAADPSQPIKMNAFVLREADGFTAQDARVLTALKNIGEGTGTAIDAAKVFRDVGLGSEEALARRLPPRSALVRDGKALARLSPEAFGAAVNEVIPESYAAAIGHLADDPATHEALVALLHKIDPPNRRQAEGIIRQALDAGFSKEEQIDMFGGRSAVTALFAQKARVLDKVLGELRKLKGAFSVAARNADALDAAGNRIDVNASTAAADGNARALDLVDRLALRKGNAVSAIFNDAAERLGRGDSLADVTRDTVRQLGKLDLTNVVREAGAADGAGDAAGGSGRTAFADAGDGAAPEPDALTPATRDELEAAGQGGFALFDEPAGQAFDDPTGEGIAKVADSAWHDAKAAVEAKSGSGIRQGAVAMALSADEIVMTLSGRETTKFPKIKLDTERKAHATIRKVDEWLVSNALAEAEARGDDFNAPTFKRMVENPRNISQGDKDSAEYYLFGEQPPVLPPFGKPMDAAPSDAKVAAISSGEATQLVQMQAEPLIAVKRGDFYEFEGEQAKAVASALNVALTMRNGKPMTGIPAHSLSADRAFLESKGWIISVDGEARAAADPNIAAKARQEADIAAQQPLGGARKTGAAQDPVMPEGLFGSAQEPTFDLGDGKGARTIGDIEAEIDADQAAVDAIKGCLL